MHPPWAKPFWPLSVRWSSPARAATIAKKLDALAAAVSPAKNKLDDERADHLSLFNIIGDPMLRMRYPGPVSLDVPATADAGCELKISGSSPMTGRATVELVVRPRPFRPAIAAPCDLPQRSGRPFIFPDGVQNG